MCNKNVKYVKNLFFPPAFWRSGCRVEGGWGLNGGGGCEVDFLFRLVCVVASLPLQSPTDPKSTVLNDDKHIKSLGKKVHLSSVQYGIYSLRAQESPHALHPVSQKFLQSCLQNRSNAGDDGSLTFFRCRLGDAVGGKCTQQRRRRRKRRRRRVSK